MPKKEPENKIYAIGDIHGQYEKLAALLSIIGKDEKATFIFLGDYIDRGPEVKKTIALCIEFSKTHHCIFLKGNHEEMMDNAIISTSKGEVTPDDFILWVSNGGNTTIQSYKGLENIYKLHKDFFKSLILFHETSKYIFVHAGIKPGIPMEKQDPQDLLWIRDNFIFSPTNYKNKLIIYGHTVTSLCKSPYSDKIGIDTGAGYGGQLTAIQLPEKKLIQI